MENISTIKDYKKNTTSDTKSSAKVTPQLLADENFSQTNSQVELIPQANDLPSGDFQSKTSVITGLKSQFTYNQTEPVQDVDPVQGLGWLKQIEINETIVNSVRTPFDYSQYTQVIRNPIKPDELITVQKIKQNVHHSSIKRQTAYPDNMLCRNGRVMELVEQDTTQYIRDCDLCKTMFPKSTNWKIWKHKDFKTRKVEWQRNDRKIEVEVEDKKDCCGLRDVCCLCYAKYFVRRQLDKKTSKQSTYDVYNLESRQAVNTVEEDKVVFQQLPDLEPTSNYLQETQNETVVDFSKLKHQPDLQFEQSQTPSFVILGLWRRDKDQGELICVRQFKVENPFFIENGASEKQVSLAEFLHIGDKKEVFFFQKFKNSKTDRTLSISFLDVDAMDQPQKLELCDNHVFKAPILGSARVIDSVFKDLLLDAVKKFEIDFYSKPKDFCTRQFISLKCGFLVFTTKRTIVSEKEQPEKLKTCPQKNWNLIFVDLVTLQPSFVIYGAFLLLKITKVPQEESSLGEQLYDVWFMEQNRVVNLKVAPFVRFPFADAKQSSPSRLQERRFECGKPITVDKKAKSNQKEIESNQTTSLNAIDWTKKCKQLWQQTQISGMMHNDDKLATVLFGNVDCFTFSIQSNCAYQIFDHSNQALDNPGTQLMLVQNRSLICTDFEFNNAKTEGQSQSWCTDITCNLIDLESIASKSLLRSELERSQAFTYDQYCAQIPKEFCSGQRKLTGISIRQIFFEQVSQHQTLSAAIFYKSQTTNSTGLIFARFLKCSKSVARQTGIEKEFQISGASSHQAQIVLERQYQINYPLIMYKSYHPLNNILMLSNFAINEPQKLIDLGSYRFLCFVDSHVPQNQTWRNKGESCIFFLVKTSSGSVRLMYYRTFAWLKKGVEVPIYPQTRQDNIQLVSGDLPLNRDFEWSHLKKAVLLLTGESNSGSILVQSYDQIFSVSFQSFGLTSQDKNKLQSGVEKVEIISKDIKMAPMEVICSQNKAFCIQRSAKSGDELLVVGYEMNSAQITKSVIYTQQVPILNMQINFGGAAESQSELSIYLLDLDGQLKLIAPSSESKLILSNRSDPSVKFEAKFSVNLAKIEINPTLENLVALPWQGVRFSSRSITTARQLDEVTDTFKYGRVVLNTNSQTKTQVDYLDYDRDDRINRGSKSQTSSIHDMRQVPEIGKSLFVVQEATAMYFLVEQDIDRKNIDFVNQTQFKELVTDIVVLASQIVVSFEYFALVFNQKDMMLSNILQLPLALKQNERSFSTQILNAFAYKGQQYVEHDGLLYCYQVGGEARLIRNNKIYTNGRALISVIKSQLAPYFQAQNVAMEKYISHYGATAVLVQLTNSKENDRTQQKLSESTSEIQSSQSYFRQQKSGTFHELVSEIQGKKQKGLQVSIARLDVLLSDKERFLVLEKNAFDSDIKIQAPQTDRHLHSCYFVMSDEFPKMINFQILLTRDYLVINTLAQVLFIEQRQIEAFKQDTEMLPKVNMNRIAVDKLLNAEQSILESGFKVYPVEDQDFETLSQTQIRRNCIQISFADEHIVWDLDHNEEVSFLTGQSQFLSEEDFVRTGFRLHVPLECERTTQRIKNVSPIQTNWDHSIVGMKVPKDSNENQAVCFRNFTLLDIFEMKYIRSEIEKQRPIKRLDFSTIFSNIYGRTLFSFFYGSSEVARLVLKVVSQMNLEPFENSHEVQFDNIIIRKLFRIITLPAKYGSTKTKSLAYRLHVKGEYIDELITQTQTDTDQSQSSSKSQRFFKFMKEKLKRGLNLTSSDNKGIHNLLSRGLNQFNQAQFDSYLDLMLLSKEAHFSNIIQEYNHFKKLLNIHSPQATHFLDNSFVQTEMCTKVDQLMWPTDQQIIVFGSRSSLLSAEEIERKFNSKADQLERSIQNRLTSIKGLITFLPGYDVVTMRMQRRVKVRIVEIEWFSQNLRDLNIDIVKQQNVNLYDNELVKVLLNQQDYSVQLLLIGFIPFCIYMGLCQYYFTYVLTDGIPTGENGNGYFVGSSRDVCLRVFILVFTILFLSIEVTQAFYLRFVYFLDMWNYLYTGSFILNLAIVCEHSMKIVPQKIQLVKTASVASIILWFMLYYWMRLFKQTAFYVLIIKETLKDIRPFLFILMIIICCFANATLIIDEYGQFDQTDHFETELLIPPSIDRTGVDAWLGQYNLLLGNFMTDGYTKNQSSRLLWIYFVLATFFTNVMFLNMLIAIMSDTFARITENKAKYALKERTELYADYIFAVKLDAGLTKYRYLYVVTPLDEQGDDQTEWSGGLSVIKNQIKAETERTLADLTAESRKIIGRLDGIQSSLDEWKQSQKSHLEDNKREKPSFISVQPSKPVTQNI